MTTTLATTAEPIADDVPTLAGELPGRDLEMERREGVNAYRGLFFGILLGLALWGGFASIVVAVVASANGV